MSKQNIFSYDVTSNIVLLYTNKLTSKIDLTLQYGPS